MHIALLGGPGDMGKGLALRWSFHSSHAVLVGSHDATRAEETATSYRQELSESGIDGRIEGMENATAAARARVVVLSVPPHHLADAIEEIADGLEPGDVLVSPAVELRTEEAGVRYDPPEAGSVTELAARVAPERVATVGAFHNLAGARLADLDADLRYDTVIVGDDPRAKTTVMRLTEEIDGLRAVDGGPLDNAPEVEALTALLVNLTRHNRGLQNPGVRFQ